MMKANLSLRHEIAKVPPAGILLYSVTAPQKFLEASQLKWHSMSREGPAMIIAKYRGWVHSKVVREGT